MSEGSHKSKVKVKTNPVLEWVHLVALLINNLDDVLSSLREKDIITVEEEAEVNANNDAPFDKKNHLVCLIRKKDYSYTNQFLTVLRSTGNHAAADLLIDPPSPEVDEEEAENHIEVEVKVDHHPQKQQQQEPDQEGLDLASEMEKELDIIQSGMDEEAAEEVKVELEPEVKEIQVQQEEVVAEPTPTPAPRVPKVETAPPPPKEFVLNETKEEVPQEVKSSIVAMNRGMFEKTLNGAAAPKSPKVSFAKKNNNIVVAEETKEEDRSESPVKNLKNFFQKLGSVDAEGGVQKRNGVANGGASQNRRTMI